MLAVLSPAKTMDMGATSCKLHSKPPLASKAEELLPALKKLGAGELKRSMGLSDDLAQLNVDRYKNFHRQQAKQACLAFDGPAYKGLQAEDFSAAEQAYAQKHLRILCGLYGVLRPYDDIRPYRLEMGLKFSTGSAKSLYEFWGDAITDLLAADMSQASGGTGPRILVNCASQEYWKSVRPKKLPPNVKVVVCDFPGPTVFAKRARGLMCRHIVRARVTDIEGLKKFAGEGEDRYTFSASKSSESKLVFIRAAGKGSANGNGGKASQPGPPKKRPSAAEVGGPGGKRQRSA